MYEILFLIRDRINFYCFMRFNVVFLLIAMSHFISVQGTGKKIFWVYFLFLGTFQLKLIYRDIMLGKIL